MQLAEQVVVITGASSGIGRCAALHLAARGARVVVTARRADALEQLVREIESDGGQAVAVSGDVTREADLRKVAETAVERFGRIDTWINNAAVYLQGRVREITPDEYRRVLEVNLLGYIIGTQCALDVMHRQGTGAIIQISSILGKRGAAYFSAYAAAKAGIDGFTQSLRSELWGTGIRVSTLYLAPVDTPIYQHARGKFGTIPKPPPPVSDPESVAKAIAKLIERPRNEQIADTFSFFYLAMSKLPSRGGDWFLHRTAQFTLSDIPDRGDNLDQPLNDVPRVRGGWAEPGWRGFTLRETVRVLPVESLLAAAALGFVTSRVARRIGAVGNGSMPRRRP
ncbi:SDR family oxidoreductase [soil metagenome]